MEPIQTGYGLMKQAFEVCRAIEKTPASTEATDAAIKATELLKTLNERFAWRSVKDGMPAIARPVWLRIFPSQSGPEPITGAPIAILCFYRGEGYWQELQVWDETRKTQHVRHPNATHWVYADCPELPLIL